MALARLGCAQQVCCIGSAGPLAAGPAGAGVIVRAFHKRSRLGPLAVARLARALRGFAPDVVQLHGEAGLFWGLPAARLAGRRPVCALVYQDYEETPAKMRVSRWLLPRTDVVVAGSDAVRRFAVERLGAPPGRTRTIHCGLDLAPFTPRPLDRLRPVRRIVTVGRLVARKGHDVAIRALALARRELPELELWIVGDGPLRAELEAVARTCGVSECVRFTGAVWPTATLLAEADLFVFPSRHEPQGLAPLEAFASGVPVIASRAGGIPEMVTDGETGVLVPPDDAAALADAIVRLARDPDTRAALAAAAATRARAFDIERIAARYVELYGQLRSRS